MKALSGKGSFGICSLVILAACIMIPRPAHATQGDFIIEIKGQVESAEFADLDGDGLQDLLVLASSGPLSEDAPSLQIFFQEESGEFVRCEASETLGDDFFMMETQDFSPSPGREIVLIQPEGYSLVAFDDDRALSLNYTTLDFHPLFYPQAHEAPYLLKCAADLDGDGHQDLMIPTRSGYAVLTGHGDGSFSKPRFLSCSLGWNIQFSDNAFFSLMTLFGKLHVLPQGIDNPLVVMETNGRITCYRYDEDTKDFIRMESPTAEFGSFATEVKQGTVEYTGIQFCDDLGKGDSCFVKSHRRGRTGVLSELKTTHTVYSLDVDVEAKKVDPTPLQKIVTDGISTAPVFSDLDTDGHKDLVLIYVKTSILTKVLEFFLNRVIITCQCHLYNPKEGRFSFAPDWSQDVPVPTQSARTVGTEGLVQFSGDFSDDNRPDMLIYAEDRLLIKRGERDSGWFSTKEVSFKSKPFYQIGKPFPGRIVCRNIDDDACPEIITAGGKIVRIVHVR